MHSLFTREIVTVEPAQNGPNLFKEMLSCFAETTDQNRKSCHQSGHRGENLQVHLEPRSLRHPTHTELTDCWEPPCLVSKTVTPHG